MGKGAVGGGAPSALAEVDLGGGHRQPIFVGGLGLVPSGLQHQFQFVDQGFPSIGGHRQDVAQQTQQLHPGQQIVAVQFQTFQKFLPQTVLPQRGFHAFKIFLFEQRQFGDFHNFPAFMNALLLFQPAIPLHASFFLVLAVAAFPAVVGRGLGQPCRGCVEKRKEEKEEEKEEKEEKEEEKEEEKKKKEKDIERSRERN